MTDQDEPTDDEAGGRDEPPSEHVRRRAGQTVANAYRTGLTPSTIVDRMRGNQGRHRGGPPTAGR